MTEKSANMSAAAVQDAVRMPSKHAQPQQSATSARDIDAEVATTSMKIQLIEFLMAQQSITYASGAINEAKRQNKFRKQGSNEFAEEWLDAAQKGVKLWLSHMKSIIHMVEKAGYRRERLTNKQVKETGV